MSYFNFIWRSHRSFLLFSMIFISLFQFLILKLVTTIDYSLMIPQMLEQLPENVKAMVGDDFLSMASVEGAAALGLNHPLVLVVLSLGAIMIPSRHIAGEVESGTLELVLSFPVKRVKLLLSLCVSAAVFLFFIVFCAWCSSLLSISIFHQLTFELFVKMSKICCNLWLLFVFIMSLTMVLSSFEKEGNKVGIGAAGIVLFFYLLHYLSSLWEAIQFTKLFNIFTYYQPGDLMKGQGSFSLHFTVLSSLIILCLFIGIYQFNRRDIPG
ncbi:MAG: ABC transporter permease subunit [Proteobacteria bacterium]|nr:ABC transporter permease subunit [Pseudomonadota bacterium]